MIVALVVAVAVNQILRKNKFVIKKENAISLVNFPS
jgi:hypothetical protein